MRCRRARTLSNRSLDGVLSPVEAEALQGHLDGCDACRAQLAELEHVHSALSSLDLPAPPGDLSAAILRAGDSRLGTGREVSRKDRSSWLLWPAVGVASAAAVLLGHLAGATVGSAPAVETTTIAAPQTNPPGLSLEEPFALLPDSEDTLVLLAFNGEEAGR